MANFVAYGLDRTHYSVYSTEEFEALDKDNSWSVLCVGNAETVCAYIESRFAGFHWGNQVTPNVEGLNPGLHSWFTYNEMYTPEPFRTYIVQLTDKPETMLVSSPAKVIIECVSWARSRCPNAFPSLHTRLSAAPTPLRGFVTTNCNTYKDIRELRTSSIHGANLSLSGGIKSGQRYWTRDGLAIKNSTGARHIGEDDTTPFISGTTEKKALMLAAVPNLGRSKNGYKSRYLLRILISELEKVTRMYSDRMQLHYSVAAMNLSHIPGSKFSALWTIYFPEVTVTSSHGLTVDLKGFAVKVKIYASDNGLGVNMRFCLEKATKQLYYARYAHSHIPSPPFHFDQVCMGSTSNIMDMSKEFEAFIYGRHVDSFKDVSEIFRMHAELFYSYVENTVKTESTGTNPYRSIAKIPEYVDDYFSGSALIVENMRDLILDNLEDLGPEIGYDRDSLFMKPPHDFVEKVKDIYLSMSEADRRYYANIEKEDRTMLPALGELKIKSINDEASIQGMRNRFPNPHKLTPQITDNDEQEIQSQENTIIFNKKAVEENRRIYRDILGREEQKRRYYYKLASAYATFCHTRSISASAEPNPTAVNEISI